MFLTEDRKLFYCNKYAFTFIVLFVAAGFGATSCAVRNHGPVIRSETANYSSADAININTASVEELQRIPYIGEKLAVQIVDHRGKYGPFRKPEQLMLVHGISDSRFRKIREMVRVD